MSVPAGYKRTEVGVIPEDWEVKPLRSLNPFITSGSRGWAKYYAEMGDAFVRITNLSRHDIYPDMSDLRRVKLPDSENEGTRTALRNGDVLVSITADIGIIGYVDDRVPKPAYINQHIATVRVNPSEADTKYLSYFLATEGSQRRVRATTDAGAKAGMSLSGVGNLLAAVPPTVAEQTVIAGALSDMDAAIATVEAVIAKMRALKTATMQALLTGTRRLPGFSGEWETNRLGDAAVLKARIGWQGLTTDEYLETGDFYLVTGTDFRDGYVDWENCCFVDERRYRQDKYIQLRQRDVLVTKDGTLGKVALVSDLPGRATLNSGIFVIRPLEDSFVPEFLYFVLFSRVFEEFLDQLSAGSTITHLYQKDFVNFVFQAPPTLEEQIAIAAVLTDMDVELAALNAHHTKLRHLKNGMTQQLLTGKRRLV